MSLAIIWNSAMNRVIFNPLMIHNLSYLILSDIESNI